MIQQNGSRENRYVHVRYQLHCITILKYKTSSPNEHITNTYRFYSPDEQIDYRNQVKQMSHQTVNVMQDVKSVERGIGDPRSNTGLASCIHFYTYVLGIVMISSPPQ